MITLQRVVLPSLSRHCWFQNCCSQIFPLRSGGSPHQLYHPPSQSESKIYECNQQYVSMSSYLYSLVFIWPTGMVFPWWIQRRKVSCLSPIGQNDLSDWVSCSLTSSQDDNIRTWLNWAMRFPPWADGEANLWFWSVQRDPLCRSGFSASSDK